LRLAVVSPFVDRRHGTERALAEVLERLAQQEGCEIHLYAQRVEDIAFRRGRVEGLHSQEIVWHKIPSIPGPQLLRFLAWIFLNFFFRRWDRIVHGVRYDLVLSPGINCLDADVIIVHALFHRLLQLSREETGGSRNSGFLQRAHRRAYYALLATLEGRLYSDPSISLAAVSPRTGNLLEICFSRKNVTIIPNGVDAARFSPANRLGNRREARQRRKFQETDFVLLLIGNDWRVKGLPILLDAVAARAELPFRILVAGDDSTEPFLESAKCLDIQERCRFEPPLANVLDLYAAADLYVSPSLEDSFGLPVAEAMACGLPVITSPLAGVSGLIKDGVEGFVLRDPKDYRELAELLARVFHDPELQRRIGQAAAIAASQWGWDRNADAIWQLLQDKLKERRLHTS
jgi:UDP-glucose:(heptosyl)LPS alpha-1,3-glucosyltransferase